MKREEEDRHVVTVGSFFLFGRPSFSVDVENFFDYTTNAKMPVSTSRHKISACFSEYRHVKFKQAHKQPATLKN